MLSRTNHQMPQPSEISLMSRPKRWDTPFSSEMSEAEVSRLVQDPVLAEIATSKFPSHTPLAGILKNDTRVRKLAAGEIIVGAGDYGSSAFCVLSGQLREFSPEQLSSESLG